MTAALALAEGSALACLPGTPEFERTCSMMAREFDESTGELRRLADAMKEQSKRIDVAFNGVDPDENSYRPQFDLEFYYEGSRYSDRHGGRDMDEIIEKMTRTAWEILVTKLGIRNIMSVKKRTEFDNQLKNGELPPITEQAIFDVITGLCDQIGDMATEAAKEVFEILRPRGAWSGSYKTNDAFRVGRKVILPWRVEQGYGHGKFRACYSNEKELVAIDGVFHVLDGKGPIRDVRAPLLAAIEASIDGKGETDFFKFKCYKNRNLHLEFKRLDLVQELNLLAVGERILGEDID